MTEDSNFLEWAFKGIVGGAFLVGGYLWTNLVQDMKSLSKEQSDFQLDAEKRFAKDDHVSETFNRLNGTLNVLQNAINTNTNMTSVINEKINFITEKVNGKP